MGGYKKWSKKNIILYISEKKQLWYQNVYLSHTIIIHACLIYFAITSEPFGRDGHEAWHLLENGQVHDWRVSVRGSSHRRL